MQACEQGHCPTGEKTREHAEHQHGIVLEIAVQRAHELHRIEAGESEERNAAGAALAADSQGLRNKYQRVHHQPRTEQPGDYLFHCILYFGLSPTRGEQARCYASRRCRESGDPQSRLSKTQAQQCRQQTYFILSTALTTLPCSEASTARWMSLNGKGVISLSNGKRPWRCSSIRRGMNSCGTLSPSMMPRTARPNRMLFISNFISVPSRDTPITPQVPVRVRDSTAWRTTAGNPVHSSEYITPPCVRDWIF